MTALRFVEIPDDHLEPLVRRRDYMLLAEVGGYRGEGYYLIRDPIGGLASYHCCGFGPPGRPIQMRCINAVYFGLARDITITEFARCVVGKAVMTCKVQDRELLERHVQAGATATANQNHDGSAASRSWASCDPLPSFPHPHEGALPCFS